MDISLHLRQQLLDAAQVTACDSRVRGVALNHALAWLLCLLLLLRHEWMRLLGLIDIIKVHIMHRVLNSVWHLKQIDLFLKAQLLHCGSVQI
jgi:hypothetical protein